MNDLGYSKRVLERTKVKDADNNDLEGTLYLVDFYLPGDTKDLEQKYFIADDQDVDTVLSNAYYEKHLSIIQITGGQVESSDVIQAPKTFTTLTKSQSLTGLNKTDSDMLKKGTLPTIQALEGGLVN